MRLLAFLAPPRLVGLLLAAVMASVLVACATAAPSTAAGPLRAKDYVPLAVGNRWEYRISPAPPDEPTGQVEILSVDDAGFYVDNHGARLAPRTDGVFDGARFILQEPIEAGHEWIAVPEPNAVERFRIVSTTTTAQVPAGTFDRCVEVEATQEMRHPATGQRATLTMTWTYAPRVGLIKAVGKLAPENQPARVTTTMELVSFQLKTPDAAPPG